LRRCSLLKLSNNWRNDAIACGEEATVRWTGVE
jgi:hypothetical protein